ncbi:hypothetical protein SAMN05444281_0564 [Wenyingzhuangia marina]|uniref:Outer membrane lipoprotein-sorting protein n=2 Tax=Wenyingzhuangia marina TaxID=1195760 RepID=A0A1M5SW89_9FLAO|nr:hypothetical protein SAMN05444281_0564 [Wenyingzhuangia marina]
MKSIFKILFLSCCFPVMLSAQTSVKDIVDTYFKAIGGIELIDQVNTFYSVSETEINGEKLTIYNKQQKPNLKSIVINKNGKFLSKKVFNGDTGYEIIGKVKKNYTKSEIYSKIDQVSIFPEFYYLKKAVFLGKKEVMGRICNVLGVGEKRIFYDVISGLKLKGSNVKLIDGQKILQETYYIDYKEIKGIKFPVTYRSIIKNREIIYNVRSISLNRDVTISDFE